MSIHRLLADERAFERNPPPSRSNWSSLPTARAPNLIFSRADRWEQVRRGGHRMLLPALKTTIKLSALVHKTSLITLMDGIYSWLKNLKSLVTIKTTEVYTKTHCRTLWKRRHVAGRQWGKHFGLGISDNISTLRFVNCGARSTAEREWIWAERRVNYSSLVKTLWEKRGQKWLCKTGC